MNESFNTLSDIDKHLIALSFKRQKCQISTFVVIFLFIYSIVTLGELGFFGICSIYTIKHFE